MCKTRPDSAFHKTRRAMSILTRTSKNIGKNIGSLRRGARQVFSTLVLTLALVSLVAPTIASARTDAQMGWGGKDDSTYVVRRGDTLSEIALYYGITQEALMYANGIRNPNHVYVGQRLEIPAKGKTGGPDKGDPECADYHYIGYGETLSSIAWQYGVDTYELARANAIYDLNEIYRGQHLCVPARGHGSSGIGGPVDQYPQKQPAQPKQPVQAKQYEQERPQAYPEQYPQQQKPKAEEPNYKQPEPAVHYEDREYGDRGNQYPEYRGEPQREPEYQPAKPDHGQAKPDERHYDDREYRDEGPQRPKDDRDEHRDGKPEQAMQGASTHWKGSYFKDKYFSEFVEERKDAEIRFNWYTGSPGDNMPEDRFSIRWEKIEYFKSGHYRFVAVADDGVRVIVDDQTVIDGWKIQPVTEYKGDIYIHEGHHKLVVEYYEEAEDAQIEVYWKPIR